MTKRRTHSVIDKLPAALRDALTRMIVDNEWPADFAGEREGSPRYEDCVLYCATQGLSVSKSAIGRWGKQLRTISLMKTAGLIARQTMANMTGEDAPKTQKAAAEMMTALTLDFMVSHDDYTSKQLREVSQAIRDCASVSITADKYIRTQIAEKIKTVVTSTKTKLTKAGVNTKLIQEIIDEHLGVVKS